MWSVHRYPDRNIPGTGDSRDSTLELGISLKFLGSCPLRIAATLSGSDISHNRKKRRGPSECDRLNTPTLVGGHSQRGYNLSQRRRNTDVFT